MTDTNTTQTTKKKPGRPKKAVTTVQQVIKGISTTPQNPDHILELIYDNPLMFKKIFSLEKAFEVSEVEIVFTPTQMQIITRDHLDKSSIHATIEGRLMYWYYCKDTVRVCIKRDNIEKAFATLTKSHISITFILKENYRSSLYCIFKDSEYHTDDQYEIEMLVQSERNHKPLPDTSSYPIQFKLSSKYFKTKISNIKKLSDEFMIQKMRSDPLQFNFEKNQKVNLISVYNDPASIELKCSLAPDDIFSVTIVIDYIKPFSNANISDDVYIAVDKNRPLSFTSYLDKRNGENVCCIRVLTDLVSI